MKKQTKEKQLRILISSNAQWATSGYAQQMAELTPRIRDAGYPIAVSAFYGLHGGIIEHDGIKHYPGQFETFGTDALLLNSRNFNSDVNFTHHDVHVLNPDLLRQVKRWIPITPIDHDPVTPAVVNLLKLAYRIIVYSKYAQKALMEAGLHSTYIPLTVDTELFKSKANWRENTRTAMRLPSDQFVFGMVSANKDFFSRKSYQEVIDAFAIFCETHPNAWLYIHTDPDYPNGFPIKQYAQMKGVLEKTLFPDRYEWSILIAKQDMGKIYNGFDCLLAPSNSEGFCVPIIEAEACEIPVITNNFTNLPELIVDGKSGYMTDVIQKRLSPQMSYVGIPDVKSLVEHMNTVYNANRAKMGKIGRKHVLENYDSKTIFKTKWLPYLENLEKEVYNSNAV